MLACKRSDGQNLLSYSSYYLLHCLSLRHFYLTANPIHYLKPLQNSKAFIQFDFFNKWSFVIIIEMIGYLQSSKLDCFAINFEFSFMGAWEPIVLLSHLLSFAFSYTRWGVSSLNHHIIAGSQVRLFRESVDGLKLCCLRLLAVDSSFAHSRFAAASRAAESTFAM